jgi:hypothetical protein
MAGGFTSIVDPQGKLQRDALIEQLSGIVCLWWSDQAHGQEVLELCGGGEMLYWHQDFTGIFPNIALMKQAGTYYVWIAGTMNVLQWQGNIIGASCPVVFSQGILVQQFFWNLSQELIALGQPYLPPPGTGAKFVVSGHSLGGACAQIIGLLLGQTYGKGNVTVLAISQPKAFTKGLNGADYWSTYVRVRVPGDPVPMLPPDSDLAFFLQYASNLATTSAAFKWLHYGKGFLLGTDGSITPDMPVSYWEDVPGQWLTTLVLNNHYDKNIMAFASKG